eukprot:symbB.v1.2.007045.t1/scaffold414.1/size398445/9
MLRKAVLVIQKGIMGVRGRVLRRGDVLGLESILLETNSLIETSQPRTLSYCFVMVLKRDDLIEVAREFEEADRHLRRAQIRAAVRRAFLTSAEQEKLRRGDSGMQKSRSVKRTFTQSQASFGDSNRISGTPPETPRSPRAVPNNPALTYAKSAPRFSRLNLEEDATNSGQVNEALQTVLERLEKQNDKIQRGQETIQRQLHLLQDSENRSHGGGVYYS